VEAVRSIKTVMENFLKKINEIYGEETGNRVLRELENKLVTSFRINTLKGSVEDVFNELTEQGFKISGGEIRNCYNIEEPFPELSLSRTRLFEEGNIYIQNISSMIPSIALDPKPGEKILDLCAAPGSKTSHIAALSGNKANITAVENNTGRFNSMKRNIEIQGVSNINFIKASSQNLLSTHPQYLNYFDKVLCDVPCSNEGLIRNLDNYDFKYWNPKNAKNISNLQKKLVASGIKMLKPGGTLIYSTCTYSVEENEQVIDWVLKKFPEMSIEYLDLKETPHICGLCNWREKVFDSDLAKTVRILPTKHFESFFIAKLEKRRV
jgi:NOL1/NOP2/sun family putative RNA methylase